MHVDSTVTHLSLCAGIGGIDLGLGRAVRGLRTIAFCEREAFACSVLAHAHESGLMDAAPIFTDLHGFPWHQFRGLVDIVSGGFPCQPFSLAGDRKSTEDERHLWPSISRGLGIVQPSVAFFENVGGISTAKSEGFHSVLHHVLSDLEGLGYSATAGLFTAEEVGAPHIRERWFILGVRNTDDDSESDVSFNAEVAGVSSDAGLADSNSPPESRGRIPGRVHSEHSDLDSSSKPRGKWEEWPARPGEPQRKEEEPRTIVGELGRTADGIPPRLDSLRALGNAVVPAVAELAFRTLWNRLQGSA
tara:strand:+ start:1466 stop:2374 length:909 start_codon:yes stop_codon:yes gene_type:complete